MKEYINKSAVKAELEKRIEETKGMQSKLVKFWAGQISAFKGVLKILDTLEVKEVDLEREVSDWWHVHYAEKSGHYHEFDEYSGHYMLNSTIIDFARYFFELGFKAKGE